METRRTPPPGKEPGTEEPMSGPKPIATPQDLTHQEVTQEGEERRQARTSYLCGDLPEPAPPTTAHSNVEDEVG